MNRFPILVAGLVLSCSLSNRTLIVANEPSTERSDQGNSLSENARLFAMATTAVADAGIVAWDTKFTNDFWRPVSGIRRADEDGNPDSLADPAWVPLGAPGGTAPDGSSIDPFTPPFPTYLSGHASFGGALFESLENFYGTDDIYFEVTSDELPGVVRSYSSFNQASEENGRSRVYLSIHWSFDDTRAREMGAKLADHISESHFLPIPEPSSGFLAAMGLLFFIGRSRAALRVCNCRQFPQSRCQNLFNRDSAPGC